MMPLLQDTKRFLKDLEALNKKAKENLEATEKTIATLEAAIDALIDGLLKG